MIPFICKRIMPFYAVRCGRKPGVYQTWDDCKAQVDKFNGAKYRKFATNDEALAFVQDSDKQGADPSPNKFTARPNSSQFHSPKTGERKFQVTRSHVLTPQKTSPHSSFQASADGNISIRKASLLSLKGSLDKIKQSMGEIRTYVTQAEDVLHSITQEGKRSSSNSYDSEPTSCYKKQKTEHYPNNQEINEGDETGPVIVYTDGACINNGFDGARAGIGVYWGPNDHRNESQRLSGRQTNNRAEIYAATIAIRKAKQCGIRDIVIKTDSQFLINCITKWIIKWKKNGWLLSNKNSVQNREELEELDAEIRSSGVNVRWVHVRGHQGIPGNEAADRLANEGAAMPPV